MDNLKNKTENEIFQELGEQHKLFMERSTVIEIATKIAINLASARIYNPTPLPFDIQECIAYASLIYRGIIKQDE